MAFICFLIAYPQIIIDFFIDKTHSTFFIADLNVFMHRFIYSNTFLTYRIYIPFIRIILFFSISKWFSKETYFIFVYFVLSVIYLHVISSIFNHFDFSDFGKFTLSKFFDDKATNFDYSYLLIQYYGFYWDFFLTRLFYYTLSSFIMISPSAILYIVHSFKVSKLIFSHANLVNFWRVLYTVWIGRVVRYSIIIYFFGGSGFRSDCIIIGTTMFLAEFTLFAFRFFVVIRAVK